MSSLPARSWSYWALRYRRTWRGSVVTGLLVPVLYLAAMGLKLGSLVNHAHGHLQGVDYLSFLAPGLLAAQAMQVGAGESMWPVLGAVKWAKTYEAMLAAPLRVIDVLLGHLGWMTVRLIEVCTIFLAVCAAFGALPSPWAAVALPAAVLTGFAFAAPIAAFSATRRNDTGFALLFRFLIVPLFLFSGTFFPIRQLPGPLQPVAWATPLYHGVQLCRSLTLGRPDLGDLVHVAYLVCFAALGVAVARITYRRRLVV
jgi:lipooligosaccharide transport system permease protein